jgi:predicted DNA-binding transcriptional regulator YafY
MKGGQGSRPSRRVISRAIIMLSLLRRQEADRAELIAHVRAKSDEEPYGENPAASFRRDLRYLEQLGIEVSYDSQQRVYRLGTESHPLWQLNMTHDEVETLALAREAFALTPYAETMNRLVARIGQRLPADLQKVLERDPVISLLIVSLDDPEILYHNLRLVKSAIVKHRLLEFDYGSPRSPEPKRYTVEPCPGSLECREGHFYFTGQLVKKSRTRDYRVDRIVPGSARLLPQKFVPRERRTRPLVLRYRLKARIARQGATPRFRGHTEEHLPNGDVIVTAEITAGELFWASKGLLKYGENCEVLEPPKLRREMARVAREMAQTYRV